MDLVAYRLAQGSKKRYWVRARQIEPGWWAYYVSHSPRRAPVRLARPDTPARPLTVAQKVAELSRGLPRCAQRATFHHGGNSKVAFTDQEVARRVAGLTGGRIYRCQLPAPAIGDHWHITMSKKKRRS